MASRRNLDGQVGRMATLVSIAGRIGGRLSFSVNHVPAFSPLDKDVGNLPDPG
jgi:hypothetical protein